MKALGFGWAVPWLLAMLSALIMWAGIGPPLVVLTVGGLLFLLVPLLVPTPEKTSAARTWQLSSLMFALLALGGALAWKHDAPLEAMREGVKATLSLFQST